MRLVITVDTRTCESSQREFSVKIPIAFFYENNEKPRPIIINDLWQAGVRETVADDGDADINLGGCEKRGLRTPTVLCDKGG